MSPFSILLNMPRLTLARLDTSAIVKPFSSRKWRSVLPRCLSRVWAAVPAAASGSLLFTLEMSPNRAFVRALIIHEILTLLLPKDSSSERKFTKTVDRKKQACVNGTKVSFDETMFTIKVVVLIYSLASGKQHHGSGG